MLSGLRENFYSRKAELKGIR